MNTLKIKIIYCERICSRSQKLHTPTPVGTFIPNSYKLVTLCTRFYTFSWPVSALPHIFMLKAFRSLARINVLPRVKATPKLVYDRSSNGGD